MCACVRVCAEASCVHTEAGDVSVQSDVFEVPLGRLRLRGVTLRHVVHGEHGSLAELGVVVKVDLGIKANHWRDGETTKGRVGNTDGSRGRIKSERGEEMAGEGKGKRRRTSDIKSKLIIIF